MLRRASSNGLRVAYATDVYTKVRSRGRYVVVVIIYFIFSIVMTNPGDVVRHVLDEITLTTTTTTTVRDLFAHTHADTHTHIQQYTMHTTHDIVPLSH